MARTEHLDMPEDHMDEIYNSDNPLVRFVHVSRLDAIVKKLPNKDNLKILDAGCGEGHLLQKMHKKHKKNKYFGIDITDAALKKARKRRIHEMRISFDAC